MTPSSRSFWTVIAVVIVVLAAIGVLINRLNAGHHRPEGIGERWLTAVSDTGRNGLRADARKREAKLGNVAAAGAVVPTDPEPDTRYFTDLEVGKAVVVAGHARVPFRLHQQTRGRNTALRTGTLVLNRTGDTWAVASVDGRRPDERVPSEGGAPPSRAPIGLWIGAVLLGVLLATGSHSIVRYADWTARRALNTHPST